MKIKELKKKKWFSIVTNMYVLVLTVFLIWMLFFDTNSYLIHLELKKEINKLEKTKEYLQNEIVKDKIIIEKLSNKGQLYAFKHQGFWQCMDTLRDKEILEKCIKQKKHLAK